MLQHGNIKVDNLQEDLELAKNQEVDQELVTLHIEEDKIKLLKN